MITRTEMGKGMQNTHMHSIYMSIKEDASSNSLFFAFSNSHLYSSDTMLMTFNTRVPQQLSVTLMLPVDVIGSISMPMQC